MKKTILILFVLFCLGLLVLPNIGRAQNPKNLKFAGDAKVLSDDCRLRGNCTLDEFVNFLTFKGQGLLAMAGTTALLMFVFGGVYWIISAGSQDKVEKGKKIMVGALIGIAIIFGAFLMIKVLEDTLGVETKFRPAGMEKDINRPDAPIDVPIWDDDEVLPSDVDIEPTELDFEPESGCCECTLLPAIDIIKYPYYTTTESGCGVIRDGHKRHGFPNTTCVWSPGDCR